MKLQLTEEEINRIDHITVDASIPKEPRNDFTSVHAYFLKDKNGDIILFRIFFGFVKNSHYAEERTLQVMRDDLIESFGSDFLMRNIKIYTDCKNIRFPWTCYIEGGKVKNLCPSKINFKLIHFNREFNWEADLACYIAKEGIFKYSFTDVFEKQFRNVRLPNRNLFKEDNNQFGGIFNDTFSERNALRCFNLANVFLGAKTLSEDFTFDFLIFLSLIPTNGSFIFKDHAVKGFVAFNRHIKYYDSPEYDDSLLLEYFE